MSRRRRPKPKFRPLAKLSPEALRVRQNAWQGSREYEHCCRIFGHAGFTVWRFSQPRATMQTSGPCDLLCTYPELKLAFWFEAKHGNARLTKDQRKFQEHVTAAGWGHYVGGVERAEEVCIEHGLAKRLLSGLVVLTPRRHGAAAIPKEG